MMAETDMKEHLSKVYVYAVATKAGCYFEQTSNSNDRDSIDAEIKSSGKPHSDSVFSTQAIELQIKSTTTHEVDGTGNNYRVRIPIKNYNDLRGDRYVPAILVVLFLPENNADWLTHSEESLIAKRCAYWVSLKGAPDVNNTTNIMIDVPKTNVFSPNTLSELMKQISITGGINGI